MYTYTRKQNKAKYTLIYSLGIFLILTILFIGYVAYKPNEEIAVVAPTDTPVMDIPTKEEKVTNPFSVEAKIVLEYFDGTTKEIPSISEFEGVYRGNQGIDYGFNKTEFEVKAMASGKVEDVVNDPLFANTIKIKSGDYVITYQSLKETHLKKGDTVKQGDTLALCTSNVYNADLGNHLHIVVTKGNKVIDPKSIINKPLN
ncbi:MAG: M23 family metallopeptidase [Erysipelotrichaceae bacterium]